MIGYGQSNLTYNHKGENMSNYKAGKSATSDTIPLKIGDTKISLYEPVQSHENWVHENLLMVKIEVKEGAFIYSEMLVDYLLHEIENWLVDKNIIDRHDIKRRRTDPSMLVSNSDGLYAVYFLKHDIKVY